MAALNANGQTIHSFFRFPINPLLDPIEDVCVFDKSDDKSKLIKALDTIIIDEVSMVRADLMDAIDYSLRINNGNEDKPFGGKQMVFIGDLLQLPPIVTKQTQQYYYEQYSSPFFFSAKVFEKFALKKIELKIVYRQQGDNNYLSFLNELRAQSVTQKMLDYINQRVGLKPDKGSHCIRLMTRNDAADRYNKEKLNELTGELKVFKAEIEGNVTPEQRSSFKDALELKIGAQVAFNKNDAQGRYYNGSVGIVKHITDDELIIVLNNGIEVETGKYKYDIAEYKYNPDNKRITQNTLGTISQFPVQLAWAITIHKSQGQTYESAVIDLGGGAFSVGQTYVAFSRVKQFDGVFLTSKLKLSDVLQDSKLLLAERTFEEVKIEDKAFDYERIMPFGCGLLKTSIKTEFGRKFGLIEEQTNIVKLSAIYNRIELLQIKEMAGGTNIIHEYFFECFYIKTKLNKLLEMFDISFNKIIPDSYEEITIIILTLDVRHNGNKTVYFVVKLDSYFGILDEKGKHIISAKFDSIKPLASSFFLVKLNGKFGVYNHVGKEVIPLIYDDIIDFFYSTVKVRQGSYWGLLDFSGKSIHAIKYEDIISIDYYKYIKLKMNGKFGLGNYKDEILLEPCLYNDITKSINGTIHLHENHQIISTTYGNIFW